MYFFMTLICFLLSIVVTEPIVGDESYSKYRLSLLEFKPEKRIGDLIIKKEIYSNSIFGTYEVIKYEKERRGYKAYIAAIMKYTISGSIPLTKQHLLDWCSQINHFNTELKQTALSLAPCLNNNIFNTNTKSGQVSYVLFETPNGGFRLEDACIPKSMMERVCLYSSKELSIGIIKLLSAMSKVTTPSYFIFHLLKEALYFGHPAIADITDNKFILIPQLNFQSFSQIATNSVLTDDQKASYSLSMMKNLSEFVFRMYTDLKNPIPVNPFYPGQTHEENPEYASLQVIDRLYMFYKEKIENNNVSSIHEDKYFGLSLKFTNSLKDLMNENQASSAQTLRESIKQLKSENLNGSVFDFLTKLAKTSFKNCDEALAHPFLSTPTTIVDTESDTGSMDAEDH